MNEYAMNGQLNPARPYSIGGMIALCLSLMLFFIQFADAYSKSESWKRIIEICGVMSMAFAILMFTQYHDLMTILSSLFWLFVIIGMMKEIYRSDLQAYKVTGILCIVPLGMNNYIYCSRHLIEILPIMQKITFVMIFTWIMGLNYKMIKMKLISFAAMQMKG